VPPTTLAHARPRCRPQGGSAQTRRTAPVRHSCPAGGLIKQDDRKKKTRPPLLPIPTRPPRPALTKRKPIPRRPHQRLVHKDDEHGGQDIGRPGRPVGDQLGPLGDGRGGQRGRPAGFEGGGGHSRVGCRGGTGERGAWATRTVLRVGGAGRTGGQGAHAFGKRPGLSCCFEDERIEACANFSSLFVLPPPARV